LSAIARIEFAPLIPLPLLAVLALAALLLVGVLLWRRGAGGWWRLLAFSAGLLALANPSLVEEQRRPLKDVAVILVDRSLSQDIGERQARTDAALRELSERLGRDDSVEVRIVESDAVGDGGLTNGTRLLGALERALADVPRQRLAGVIALSDGQVHDAPSDPASEAPAAPFHLLLTGERGERDRRLAVESAPSFGIVGEELAMTLSVQDQGGTGGDSFVTMRQDDGPPRAYPIVIGRTLEVPFRLEHAGPTVIEIETPAGPEELTLRNNRAVLVVNGVRERLRVLLVSGEPHAGERTWRNILKSDPSVDLVHFTILRPPQKQDGTPIRELSLISFPTRELFQTKLYEFDLVIFDRYRRRGVLPDTYLRNVVRYVQSGGAVLTAAGPAFATPLSLDRTPLGDVLPSHPTGAVQMTGYRPTLTQIGNRHPVTAELPGLPAEGDTPSWGRWFRLMEVERVRGETLMHGPGTNPLLILDRVGEGRVAQLLSDHAWLWARGYEGGGPQAELLRRIAHWLMKEPDLEEDDLRTRVDGARIEVTRRSLKQDGGTVRMTLPSGRTIDVELTADARGRETGSVTVAEPGLYRLSDGQRRAVAAVGEINPVEYADMRTSAEPLAALVKQTGGGTFWLADGVPDLRRVRPDRDATGRGWVGLRAAGDYVVTGVSQYPLLPGVVVLLGFLGVTLMAWYREGR